MKKIGFVFCLILFCGESVTGFMRLPEYEGGSLIVYIKRRDLTRLQKRLATDKNLLVSILNERGPDGHSPLQEAVILGDGSIFNEIMRAISSLDKALQYEIVAHVNKFGFNALLDAAEHNRVDIMQRFLGDLEQFSSDQRGSILNQVNFKGETALMTAARKGNQDIVGLLLGQPSLDPFMVNREGKTAFDLTTNPTIKRIIQDAIEEKRKVAEQALMESTSVSRDPAGSIGEFLYGEKPKKIR